MDELSSDDNLSEISLDSLSDTSDEDINLIYAERIRPKNENYIEDTVSRYSHNEFMEHFRVSRNIATEVAQQFEASNYFKYYIGEHEKLSAYHHTIVFLWYAGHETSSFRDVADRFDISISCLWRVIRRMIYFLSNDLSASIIKWPSIEERVIIERHFRDNGFPGVIGVIDGTHVRTDKPKYDPDSYLNRKHYFSIQAQVVCDHNRIIRSIFVGYPGSVHDSRVFRSSPLHDTLREKCGDHYLLGDSGYPCLPNLLTPFRDRGQLRQVEILYNRRLSKNRYIIEHCFGILKQKFRQLYHIKLKIIPDIVHFIRACCVLHNLAIKDEFPDMDIINEQQQLNEAVNVEEFNDDSEDDRDGVEIRNFVCRNVLPHY